VGRPAALARRAMKLVGVVTAGNSSDVLVGCIDHHRAMGVDEFLLVHVYSEDDTPEQMRQLARGPGVRAIFPGMEEVVSGTIVGTALDLVRSSMSADWIVYIDSDERWLSRRHDLKLDLAQVTCDAAIAPRYNVVWPTTEAARCAGASPLAIDGLPIAAFPVDLRAEDHETLRGVPWVLTRILPKCCIRARPGIGFFAGGHWAVERETGARMPADALQDVLVAQLAFTSRERFQNKTRFLHWIRTHHGERAKNADEWGWHWDRLARMAQSHPHEIQAEWERQFLSPAAARALVGREVIIDAAEVLKAHG